MKFLTLVTFLFLSIQLFAVNINTATKKELQTLKGIGEKTAQAIIDYRKIHPFTSKKELTHVRGIGNKKFEVIKSEISVK